MREFEFDLIVRNVLHEDSPSMVDIGIVNGRITALRPTLTNDCHAEIDGQGWLASPFLVDPHAHLDKAFVQPQPNRSGTLQEAMAIMQANKQRMLDATFDERVDRILYSYLRHGVLLIRSHVDIGPITGASTMEAMMRIQERWADKIDIQLVAFPQDGLIGKLQVQDAMRRCMSLGVNVVGGIPAIESTAKAAREHIDFAFDLATEFDAAIDMHVDETDDPRSRTLEMLAEATLEAGWQGRVAAAHCTALAAYDDHYARQVIEKVAEAQIHVITNPTTNLVLQGRYDAQPVRRGITRVKELLAAGVNVACGHDNMRDAFYPFGKGDMLEVAFVTALASHLTGTEEIRTAFAMPRARAAAAVGFDGYGLRERGPADFILLPVASAEEALAERPAPRTIFKNGRVICRITESVELPTSPLAV